MSFGIFTPLALGIGSAFLLTLGAGSAYGQAFPAKPVRIVTSDAGGGNDFAARLIAPVVAKELGQAVIVDNQGASLVAQQVAKAPADGYTVAFSGTTLWLGPFLRESTSWDPIRDFAPITLALKQPNVLVVHPSLQVKSVKEFIALVKSRPGALNYSSGPIGGPQHLTGELFKAMGGLDMVVIPFKGAGQGLAALVAGQVQAMFPTPALVSAQIKSGKVIALGVTSAQATPLLPGLPPVADAIPGYESLSLIAFFAPAATPSAIVGRLNREFVKALQRADIREPLLKNGVETVGSTPDELGAIIKAEIAKWGPIIKAAGIKEQ